MSVSSTTRKTDPFTLDQVEDEFAFTFKTMDAEDIKCAVTTNSTTYYLTYTTDYTVDLESDGVGGTVTLVDPATVSLGTLVIYRETTDKQESDYDDYNQFPADTLEDDLDRRTLLSQEQAEDSDRTVKAGINSTLTDIYLPDPSAGKALVWNATLDGFDNTDTAIDDVITAAQAAQTAAELAETNAETAETAAELAETNAEASETAAASYATIALSGLSLQGAYDVGQTITIGTASLAIYNSTTLSTISITNGGTGEGLYVYQSGILAADKRGLLVLGDANNTTGVALFEVNLQGTSTIPAAIINNYSTGHGLYINQTAILAGASHGFYVLAADGFNQTNADSALVKFTQDDADSTEPVLEILNDGTGSTITINNTMVVPAFSFEGAEVITDTVGTTQDKKIYIKLGTTAYYIPCYTE